MSDMKLERPFTPRRLVERGMMLNVPVYQRLFVWEADRIQKLLLDLADSYRQSNGPYNIGIMSVWVNAKEGNVLDVVDGQQRLTFLSLWAAWSVAKLSEDSEVRKMWRRFLFSGEKLRLSFTGRPDDEKAILALANGKAPPSGAFRRFAETADAFVSNRIDEQDEKMPFNREDFAQYVYENCAFLVDELPSGYGPYELNLYFEKMNSTGRQLEPIDMVKGLYFSSDDFARRWNRVFRTGGGGSQRRVSIADIIEANEAMDKESPADGHPDDPTAETRRLVSDEVLLLHALRIVNNGDKSFSLDRSRLLEMFGKHFNDESDEKKETFLGTLEEYALWMEKHVIRLAKDEKQGVNRYVFTAFDDDNVGDGKPPQDEEDAKAITRSRRLRQFESMLFVSSTDSQDWIMEAYLKTDGKDTSDDDLLNVLKKIDAENHPFPDDERDDNSPWTYGRIDRYWFWKLDYLLWEQHETERREGNKADSLFWGLRKEDGDDDAISGYIFRKDRSIEHLHPQNPPPEGESQDWEEDRQNEVRDGFGNLAMISSSFNSVQSNDSISTKMGRIDDQVREMRLQSIKLLLMIRSVKSSPAGWSVKAAREHKDKMLELLKNEQAVKS